MNDYQQICNNINPIPLNHSTNTMASDKKNENQGNWVEARTNGECSEQNGCDKNNQRCDWLPASKIQFQKLKETLTKKSNWILYKQRIVSEIEAQQCDFLLKCPVNPPNGMDNAKIEARSKLVRNFLIKNTGDDLLHVVARQPSVTTIIDALDRVFDPRGESAKYSLIRQMGDLIFDPDTESALAFNSKFLELVEKICRVTNYSDEEEKTSLFVCYS